MHTIFNDKATMLPYLPMLCPMSVEAMAARRKRHRAEVQEEKALYLDIILTATGELLGTTGFRSMNKVGGTAEWGVIISKNWQRKGICAECFVATLSHAVSCISITKGRSLPLSLPPLRIPLSLSLSPSLP